MKENDEEPEVTWEEINVPTRLVHKCRNELGLMNPTPVQAACIRAIFEGRNCLARSPTGSGKTLTFGIPMIGKLFEDPYGVFGVVLTPTRELAYQIKDQFEVLGGQGIRISVIVGGVDMQIQAAELERRPHFIIGTPGRLSDLMESNPQMFQTILKYLRFLVIDEADRVLDGQFDQQLSSLKKFLPDFVQVLLFSATVNDNLIQIAAILMAENNVEPLMYSSTERKGVEKTLVQKFVLCPPDFKDGYLIQLLCLVRDNQFEENVRSIIIFAPTNRDCEILSILLSDLGFSSVLLHSMMLQKARLNSLAQFKSRVVNTLIATDIASRGLDIHAVDLIINYSIPMPVDYVHRIGRAGRGYQKGTAVSLVTPRDVRFLKSIEEHINLKLSEYKIDEQKVLNILKEVSATKKAAVLNAVENNEFVERKRINKRKARILDGQDPSSNSSDRDDSDEEKKRHVHKKKPKMSRRKALENTK